MIETPRPPHAALAVLGALALHALAGLGLGSIPRPALSPPRLWDVAAEIELSLTAGDAPASPLTPLAATPANAVSPATSRESPRARFPSGARADRKPAAPPLLNEANAAEIAERTNAASEPLSDLPAGAPRRAIDLGLNEGVRRAALLGGWVELPSRPDRPSDGGLRQGLAALDAERGQSRSSPANHAAYKAARRFAPATGMGIFDVVADERGVVLSVTLASASADEAKWQRVGRELDQLLKGRRLRVAHGAKGLAARLRIETGELAQDISERIRSKRGAALGQAPVHPREMRAESTRDSLGPGHLSPTLGIIVAGGGSNQGIRVVLLDEHSL